MMRREAQPSTAARMARVRAAMTLDDRLDDVTRARIWAALDRRLAAEVRAGAAWRRWRWPVACAIAGCAAVLAIASGRERSRHMVSEGPARAIVAPADTTVTATIAVHTRAALVGPAELDVVGARTVRLVSGTLYASFEGGPGRSLRVEAPGAVVDVVGTLFAVEAGIGAAPTCVSVAHGRVRMTMGPRIVMVGGGERVCTGPASAVGPIRPGVKEALVRHEDGALAGAAPAAPVSAPAAPVPAPAAPAPAPAAPAPAPVPARAHPPMPDRSVAATSHPRPSPPEAPAPAPAPPAVPTASALYALAEAALTRHDPAAADRALARLIATAPGSPLVDEALYERARIAYARHAWAAARRALDALAAIPQTPLAEAGRWLACRIAVEAHDGDAARCLADYRAAFPRSPHDSRRARPARPARARRPRLRRRTALRRRARPPLPAEPAGRGLARALPGGPVTVRALVLAALLSLVVAGCVRDVDLTRAGDAAQRDGFGPDGLTPDGFGPVPDAWITDGFDLDGGVPPHD